MDKLLKGAFVVVIGSKLADQDARNLMKMGFRAEPKL